MCALKKWKQNDWTQTAKLKKVHRAETWQKLGDEHLNSVKNLHKKTFSSTNHHFIEKNLAMQAFFVFFPLYVNDLAKILQNKNSLIIRDIESYVNVPYQDTFGSDWITEMRTFKKIWSGFHRKNLVKNERLWEMKVSAENNLRIKYLRI